MAGTGQLPGKPPGEREGEEKTEWATAARSCGDLCCDTAITAWGGSSERGHAGWQRGDPARSRAQPRALLNPLAPGALSRALNPALYAPTPPRGGHGSALITAQQITRHGNDAFGLGAFAGDDIFPVDGVTYSRASTR